MSLADDVTAKIASHYGNTKKNLQVYAPKRELTRRNWIQKTERGNNLPEMVRLMSTYGNANVQEWAMRNQALDVKERR